MVCEPLTANALEPDARPITGAIAARRPGADGQRIDEAGSDHRGRELVPENCVPCTVTLDCGEGPTLYAVDM